MSQIYRRPSMRKEKDFFGSDCFRMIFGSSLWAKEYFRIVSWWWTVESVTHRCPGIFQLPCNRSQLQSFMNLRRQTKEHCKMKPFMPTTPQMEPKSLLQVRMKIFDSWSLLPIWRPYRRPWRLHPPWSMTWSSRNSHTQHLMGQIITLANARYPLLFSCSKRLFWCIKNTKNLKKIFVSSLENHDIPHGSCFKKYLLSARKHACKK